MKANERKDLRRTLLQGLYDNHFANKGKDLLVREGDMEIEVKLAYRYLIDKNLAAKARSSEKEHLYKITAKGIDVIENNTPLHSMFLMY
jgi:hypothetical protein